MERLRILINEDLPSDAELLEYEIRRGGFDFVTSRVENREGFLEALEQFRPDLIISDYHLPCFDGMQALTLAREHSPLIPFIIVTGAMNEEIAVECMKAGADDYVLKEHLKRLVPAISVALANSHDRRQKVLAEERLMSSEKNSAPFLKMPTMQSCCWRTVFSSTATPWPSGCSGVPVKPW